MSMFIQFNLSTYSNSCSVRLPVSTSSQGSYIVASVISYYSCMQQCVDRHPCLVTIYSMFTDIGQEVLAPTVYTHNRHQLSHQLPVVTASTCLDYYMPMVRVSVGRLPMRRVPNRRGFQIVMQIHSLGLLNIVVLLMCLSHSLHLR